MMDLAGLVSRMVLLLLLLMLVPEVLLGTAGSTRSKTFGGVGFTRSRSLGGGIFQAGLDAWLLAREMGGRGDMGDIGFCGGTGFASRGLARRAGRRKRFTTDGLAV